MVGWESLCKHRGSPSKDPSEAIEEYASIGLRLSFASLAFLLLLLDIHFIYISNAIPKVPYTQPTHSCFLAQAFPCTGAYDLCKTEGLSSH